MTTTSTFRKKEDHMWEREAASLWWSWLYGKEMVIMLTYCTDSTWCYQFSLVGQIWCKSALSPFPELKQLKLLQQGSGNAAKERPLTSFLQWPHESGHQVVGGMDLSSTRHPLTPVVIYLAWFLANTNWCWHLLPSPLWCLILLPSSLPVAFSVISSTSHFNMCSSQAFPISAAGLFVLVFVFLGVFSLSLSLFFCSFTGGLPLY